MEPIYNQNDIPKDVWRYGLRSSAAVGCGWVAAYNVLALFGYRADPEKLIRSFEHQLPLIHGNTGTSFWGPAAYFRSHGFPVQMSADRRRYDEIVKKSDAAILFFYWRDGIRMGAHFVTVRWDGRTCWGYNTYRNSKGADNLGISLEAFIRQRGYFGTVLTGISQKDKAED